MYLWLFDAHPIDGSAAPQSALDETTNPKSTRHLGAAIELDTLIGNAFAVDEQLYTIRGESHRQGVWFVVSDHGCKLIEEEP